MRAARPLLLFGPAGCAQHEAKLCEHVNGMVSTEDEADDGARRRKAWGSIACAFSLFFLICNPSVISQGNGRFSWSIAEFRTKNLTVNGIRWATDDSGQQGGFSFGTGIDCDTRHGLVKRSCDGGILPFTTPTFNACTAAR